MVHVFGRKAGRKVSRKAGRGTNRAEGRGTRRRTSRGAAVTALTAVLTAAAATLPPVTAQATTPIAGSAKPGTQQPESPFERARRTKTRVEITTARTEYNTSYADPSGTTTLRMSTVPVRVRRGTGWTAVDPTLARRTDGTIAPKASTLDVGFSGGGDVPLITYHEGDRVLHIDAPMALPAPVLSGTSATYPEVLPGVDLVVNVTGESFGEVFVVKTAAAAKNPALKALRFALAGRGLELHRTASGGIDVTGSTGSTLLSGEQPRMWDSRSRTGSGAAGARASAQSPGEGDHQAPIKVSAGATALTLTPDTSLLTAPDTVFPVYIDPSVPAKKTAWAMVNKAYPTTSYYKWTGSNGEGMGYYNYNGEGPITKRLFFAFNTSSMRTTGRTIVSSTLSTNETWAFSCTTSSVETWLTGGISSSTTWNNQPSWTGPTTTRNVATSGRPECSPGGSSIDFDATYQVIKSVQNNWATTTIGMRATNEASNTGWRRFDNAATLEVVYNTIPNMPSAAQMTSPPTKCGGAVPAGDMPILSATLTDPDGTKNQVRGHFQIYKSGSATPIVDVRKAYGASGSKTSHQVAALAAGLYSWRVMTEDNQSPQLWSPWTNLCNFTVDATAPTPPVITFDSGTFAVGQDVHFHFTGGGPGVASYRWAVNTDAPNLGPVTPAEGGAATIHLTSFGPFVLHAWAYDTAGNRGGQATYGGEDFLVSGADALDWWRMDEADGYFSTNQRSSANPLITAGGMTRTPGFPNGNAMLFDGTGGGAGAGRGGPANGQNFSLSGWVNPSTTTGRQVVLSQDAAANSAYAVAVENIAGPVGSDGVAGPVAPRFTATLNTTAGAVAMKVVSSRPLQEDEWAHFSVGVQSLESGAVQLALYTTGAGDAQITENTAISTTTTPDYAVSAATSAHVRVGVELHNYGPLDYWHGAIDEIVTAQGIFDELQRNQWRYPAP